MIIELSKALKQYNITLSFIELLLKKDNKNRKYINELIEIREKTNTIKTLSLSNNEIRSLNLFLEDKLLECSQDFSLLNKWSDANNLNF